MDMTVWRRCFDENCIHHRTLKDTGVCVKPDGPPHIKNPNPGGCRSFHAKMNKGMQMRF